MKVLITNKEENGIEHILRVGGGNFIINEQNDIKIPLSYDALDILEKHIGEMKNKIKPVRGLRRFSNVIDEACDMDKEEVSEVLHKFYNKSKENNIYLNKKERESIKIQIEQALRNFECEVDTCLRNNDLKLAKLNHNVIDTCRSILNKIEVADCEEPRTYDYYLTIDLSRDGDNKAILFKRYENSLKIEKFVSFYEKDCTNMVHKFLEEIKELNCAILIPNIVFGALIIDYFKAEGFEDIIEISSKDIHKAMSINDLDIISTNCDELYTRILLYTTSKLGFNL